MLQNGGKVVNVRAFLYAIAKNVRADYYRRSRDYCLSTEQCVDLVKCDDPERSEDIVYAALAKLSAQDAKLIKLRIMGYSYRDLKIARSERFHIAYTIFIRKAQIEKDNKQRRRILIIGSE